MTYRQIRDHKFKILFMYMFLGKEINECIDLYFEYFPYEDEIEDENTYVGSSLRKNKHTNSMSSLNNGNVEEDLNITISDDDNIRDINNKLKNLVYNVNEIDNILKESIKNWEIGRIAKAELTILRLAIYEMYFDNTMDIEVAINEAVELAKVYGDNDADKFVNGILATIYKSKK